VLGNVRRRLEHEYETVSTEKSESVAGQRDAVEKAKRAINDAFAIAEDLKKEKEQSTHLEKMKKNMELTIKG